LTHLSDKSKENIEAAEMLISNSMYASSVHCSYYAMLQHLTCKLVTSWNISFIELSNKSKASKKNSHQFLINEGLDIVEKKRNSFVRRGLKNDIRDLKQYREESDYHNLQIGESKGRNALALSRKIIKNIEENLQ
jgi:hypothetical protein